MASSSHSINLVKLPRLLRLLRFKDRLGKQLQRDVVGLSAYYCPLSLTRELAKMQPPDKDGGWQEQVSSKASVIGHIGKALNQFNCSSLRIGLGRWMVDGDGA